MAWRPRAVADRGHHDSRSPTRARSSRNHAGRGLRPPRAEGTGWGRVDGCPGRPSGSGASRRSVSRSAPSSIHDRFTVVGPGGLEGGGIGASGLIEVIGIEVRRDLGPSRSWRRRRRAQRPRRLRPRGGWCRRPAPELRSIKLVDNLPARCDPLGGLDGTAQGLAAGGGKVSVFAAPHAVRIAPRMRRPRGPAGLRGGGARGIAGHPGPRVPPSLPRSMLDGRDSSPGRYIIPPMRGRPIESNQGVFIAPIPPMPPPIPPMPPPIPPKPWNEDGMPARSSRSL